MEVLQSNILSFSSWFHDAEDQIDGETERKKNNLFDSCIESCFFSLVYINTFSNISEFAVFVNWNYFLI